MACEKCHKTGWIETPRGFKRCDCVPVIDRTPKEPVLTAQETTIFVEMLASLPYFPSEAGARLAIGDELRSMCHSLADADWLVKRMMRLYQRWPGPNEMRMVFVSKHPPRDGVMPVGISESYPDGIPSEREQQRPQIAGPELRALPPGHAVTADPQLEEAVREVAEVRRIPPARIDRNDRFTRKLEEILTPPQARPVSQPTPQIVTEEDIQRAVEERQRTASHQQGDESGVSASPEREEIGARHEEPSAHR